MKYSKSSIRQIVKACRDYKVNSNRLSESTPLKQSTAYRILTEETQNPSEESIDHIVNYLKEHHPEIFDGDMNLIVGDPLEYHAEYQQVLKLVRKMKPVYDSSDLETLERIVKDIALSEYNYQSENAMLKTENTKLKDAYKELSRVVSNL